MNVMLSLAYGVLVYLFFAATFAYAVLFVGNLAVPKSIDIGAAGPLAQSIAVNLALLALFAIQHSVMARRAFKRWWTRIIPPAAERSTFVLASTAVLALLLWQWQPIPEPVLWRVASPAGAAALQGVFWLGWAVALVSTFLIDHFELFGLRQAYARLTGREPAPPALLTPWLYRHVRHPLYLGFLLAFWATPVMSAGHLLFSLGMTGYILIGIWFEERDLIAQFGERYRAYRRQVGMLLPWRGRASRGNGIRI